MLSSVYILQANATAQLCWLLGAWISKQRFSSCTACEHLSCTTAPPCPLPGFKLPPRTTCKFCPVAAAGITLHRMSLFSWGPAHAVSVSCEHLPPSAYGRIPLHPSGLLCIVLHPLCPCVSPCTSGWPEQGVRPVSRLLLHLLLPLGRSEI